MGVDRLDSEAERLSAARGLREVAKPVLLLTEANARPSEERESLDLGAWGSVAPRRVERLPREQQGLREIVLGPRQLRVPYEREGEHRSALDPQRLRRPKHRVARFGALALDPERRRQLEIDVRAVSLVARKVARAEQHVLGLVSAPRRSECGPELEKHVDFLRDAGALSRGQPEMIDRRVIGTYRDRATGRIASVRDGLRVVARGGEVAGEGRMEPIVAELFERLAHAEVEPRPPLIRDRARDRVASERVAEHVHLPLRGRALEELRFDRRGEIADELVLGSVREGDNDLVRQRDGGDRERLQEVRGLAAALLREPRHAHLDRVADGPRKRQAVGARFGVIDRGLEKLLHVERDG